MILTTLIGAVIIIVGYFLNRKFTYWTRHGVKQIPIKWMLSRIIFLIRRRLSFLDSSVYMYQLYPETRYNGIYQISKPVLLIKDPDLITDMSITHFDNFGDHSFLISERFEPMWAKNLFMLKGKKWRAVRSILSATYTVSKMKILFGIISETAQNFSDYFLKKDEDVIEVELKDTYMRLANDILATTAYGIKINSLTNKTNEFYLMTNKIFNFTQEIFRIIKLIVLLEWPKLYEFMGIPVFDPAVNDFFTKIIDDTITTREQKGIVRPDMVHLLMEAKKRTQNNSENDQTTSNGSVNSEKLENFKLTNEDIAAQAFFFFVAGFDSVASALSFLSFELCENPDIQNRLRKEIEETFEECNGDLTYDALAKMKYMDMVLSESLRKWPPVFAAERACTKPYTIEPKFPHEQPVHLKKDVSVFLPIYALHRDPKNYPNPDLFDPERFSDVNKKNIKSGTYLPFGLGPRNCIAFRFALLEVKAVMFKILHNFEIVPISKTPCPLKLQPFSLNMMAEGGFWVGLKKIQK